MATEFASILASRFSRLAITLAAITACCVVIWIAGKVAFSTIFAEYALSTGNIIAGNDATSLAPSDPEAHFVLGEILKTSGLNDQAVTELEKAAALRPRDYFLWLELGMTRDQLGSSSDALAALNEAVRLAPHYAQPLWQRGNLLLRIGRYDEAFADLRAAAESNPEFLPNVMDLAWGITHQDAVGTEQLVQVKTSKMRMTFAVFLARQGRAAEALDQYRAAGSVSETEKQDLVRQLIDVGGFREAFRIWRGAARDDVQPDATQIYDGGFEGPLILDETTFGWRIPHYLSGVNMSLDPINPQSGAKSLHVEFDGNSSPEQPYLSQLIVVDSSSRYRMNLAKRAQDVVTGGLPVIVVSDAGGDRKRLAKSAPLSEATAGWRGISFEFETGPTTTAVVLSGQRETCSTDPCPMFGSLWLDSFSLEKIK